MEAILPLIVQLIGGGAGGNIVGKLAKGISLGGKGDMITGALGGLVGTFIAGQIPGLEGLIGGMGDMAGGADAGGLDIGALLGQGATGLAGGGILTAVVGFVKNNVMKS